MIGCIVQARMGSTRLTGKVMRNIDKKNPLLFYVIKQLESCKRIEKIVVATSALPEDDIIVENVKKSGIEYYRGSATDVLDRYYQCASRFSFSTIVRITSDNPLIDPQIVDMVIEKFNSNSFDYVSNCLYRTFPYGTEVEVFSFYALKTAWKQSTKPSEREHVTPFIYKNKNSFKIFNIEYGKNISNYRWTVDTLADLRLVKNIVSNIKKRPILMQDILDLFLKRPELVSINKNVIPNEGYLKSLKEDAEFMRSGEDKIDRKS